MEIKNIPCVVEYDGKIYKTNKTVSFFQKHREIDLTKVKIHYIDKSLTGMSEVDKALQRIENELKGIETKQQIEPEARMEYEYRLNQNTVLKAYSKEQVKKLSEWYQVDWKID